MWPHNPGGDWRQQMTGGGHGGGPTPSRCSECLRCRQASLPTGQDLGKGFLSSRPYLNCPSDPPIFKTLLE